MQRELLEIVERFPGRRVLLVGDFMLDRYVFGDAERISPEAPVPVLRVRERQDRVGGAGSVALNLAALGAQVACFGLLGRDRFGEQVTASLAEAGAATDGLVRADDRPTITKTRLVGLAEHRHRQQILRVDDEIVQPPTEADARRLIDAVRAAVARADVVCLEDYAKGVLSPDVCEAIVAAARAAGKPVLVDPARGGGWEKYRGATCVTPNLRELQEIAQSEGLRGRDLPEICEALCQKYDFRFMLVTLGPEGMYLHHPELKRRFPARALEVYDVSGAGDTVVATLTTFYAAGLPLAQVVELANRAAGIVVGKVGTQPILLSELEKSLKN